LNKWEKISETTEAIEGAVGTEVTEKMEIPEGTLYKNVICFGIGSLMTRVQINQTMIFVPKVGWK